MSLGIDPKSIYSECCYYCYKEKDEKIIPIRKYHYHVSCLSKMVENPMKKEIITKILDEYYDNWMWTTGCLEYVSDCIDDEIVTKYRILKDDEWLQIYVSTNLSAMIIRIPYVDDKFVDCVAVDLELLAEINGVLDSE